MNCRDLLPEVDAGNVANEYLLHRAIDRLVAQGQVWYDYRCAFLIKGAQEGDLAE